MCFSLLESVKHHQPQTLTSPVFLRITCVCASSPVVHTCGLIGVSSEVDCIRTWSDVKHALRSPQDGRLPGGARALASTGGLPKWLSDIATFSFLSLRVCSLCCASRSSEQTGKWPCTRARRRHRHRISAALHPRVETGGITIQNTRARITSRSRTNRRSTRTCSLC